MYLIHARKRPSVKNAAVVSVAGYMGLESNGLGVSFKATLGFPCLNGSLLKVLKLLTLVITLSIKHKSFSHDTSQGQYYIIGIGILCALN